MTKNYKDMKAASPGEWHTSGSEGRENVHRLELTWQVKKSAHNSVLATTRTHEFNEIICRAQCEKIETVAKFLRFAEQRQRTYMTTATVGLRWQMQFTLNKKWPLSRVLHNAQCMRNRFEESTTIFAANGPRPFTQYTLSIFSVHSSFSHSKQAESKQGTKKIYGKLFDKQNSMRLHRQTLFDKLLFCSGEEYTKKNKPEKELSKSYRLQTRRRIDIWHLCVLQRTYGTAQRSHRWRISRKAYRRIAILWRQKECSSTQ